MTASIIPFPRSCLAPASAGPTAGGRRLLGRLVARLVERDRIYREQVYLAEMDDRMLRDIGLTPAGRDAEIRRLGRSRTLVDG